MADLVPLGNNLCLLESVLANHGRLERKRHRVNAVLGHGTAHALVALLRVAGEEARRPIDERLRCVSARVKVRVSVSVCKCECE